MRDNRETGHLFLPTLSLPTSRCQRSSRPGARGRNSQNHTAHTKRERNSMSPEMNRETVDVAGADRARGYLACTRPDSRTLGSSSSASSAIAFSRHRSRQHPRIVSMIVIDFSTYHLADNWIGDSIDSHFSHVISF